MKALLSKFRDSIALNRTTNNFLRFEAFFFRGAPVARVVNGKDKKLLRYVFFPKLLDDKYVSIRAPYKWCSYASFVRTPKQTKVPLIHSCSLKQTERISLLGIKCIAIIINVEEKSKC